MKSGLSPLIALGAALTITSLLPVGTWATTLPTADEPPALSKAHGSAAFGDRGIETQYFSSTVKPGDDFFTYVNEGWIKSTPVPEGYWDYGQTNILQTTVEGQIRSLVAQSLATRSPRGTAAQEVGDGYASFLDTAGVERRGLSAVRRDLKRIMASNSLDDIARQMADPTSSSIVAINIFPEEGQPRVHLDQQNLSQPMLGLPNPASYSTSDATALRDAYVAYIASVLQKAGMDHPGERARHVLAIETQIAANQWPFDKLRDRKANYHPMSVQELIAYAPGFPWRSFLTERGVAEQSRVVLGTDTAIQLQARLFAETPIDDWKSYLAFHWLQNQMDVLPEKFRQASWEFYGKRLSNAKNPTPREEVALRLVNSALGQQVGQLYANRYVSADTRAAAEEMIACLRKAFAERLANVIWMDAATRTEAQAKLARFSFKVGYPKIWRDFSHIDIRRSDPVGNLQRLRRADWTYQLHRLDPGSRDEPWYQTPQTVDASYSVLLNAIELPGAFLQPPYFDVNADPAVNFGAIGAIIGHEMGHGFDDQGILYDSQQRIRNWWSDDALNQFHSRTQALVGQYDAFSPYPDVNVNGRQTIGENIADLSGVSLAYRAYHMYLADHPKVGPVSSDDLSGDRLFFEGWAQAWRYEAPESAIRYVISNSTHAPTQYRVNGVMQNLDAWYEAFDVKPGDKLYVPPEKRVRIW